MPRCFDCRHWAAHDITETDPSESLGQCDYSAPIPHAWRYCLRERVGTYGDEGQFCPVFDQGSRSRTGDA